MDASLCAGPTEGDKSLLLDLGVERVERLRHVVVESAWLSVVLTSNGNNGADLLGLNKALSAIIRAGSDNSGVVVEALLRGLCIVLGALDRELKTGLVARLKTPIGTQLLSILSLVILSQA